MSAKQRVRARVKQLGPEAVNLSRKELALKLAPEFPELAFNTLKRYCCADELNPSRPEVTIVASDFHVPFHNVPIVENWLGLCAEMQPDHIAINGDFLDCISISRFLVPPGVPLLQDEIDAGVSLLIRLRKLCPDSTIYFLDGNHEKRLEALLMANPGLYGLQALSIRSLLELDRLNIRYSRYMDPVNIGRLTVVHGNRVSKHAAYAAKSTIVDGDFQNVVVGHTHRLGLYCHTGARGKRRAAEIGGLFDSEQADYIKGTANWQNGFAIWRELGEWDDLELVEVSQDGRFFTNGKFYG
jgi:predicted phosphodiesterase